MLFRSKALALVEELLAGRPPATAVRRSLGERWPEFEKRSRDHALRVLRPLLEEGRAELLALRESVEARKFTPALAEAGGVYRLDDAYYRALGLEGLGRSKEALDLLRRRFVGLPVRDSTLLVPALRLEMRLLEALGKPAPARPELRVY